jgi:hypothetical protein
MEGLGERDADEQVASGRAHARSQPARAGQRRVFEGNRQRVRHQREQLRQLAAVVAATEDSLAATYRGMAVWARHEGRSEDARRLESEAEAAMRFAEDERQQAEQPVVPKPPAHHPADAEHLRAAVSRAQDEAARRHHEATRLREEAARRRDEAAVARDEGAAGRDDKAGDRDEEAVDRAVLAGRRNAAAADRQTEEEQWAGRVATAGGGRTSPAPEEQATVDDEVEASYRALAEDNRRRTAADRAADSDDRHEARKGRLAAAQDRTSARADREAAVRDRAAAESDREHDEADREQDEIDRETRS